MVTDVPDLVHGVANCHHGSPPCQVRGGGPFSPSFLNTTLRQSQQWQELDDQQLVTIKTQLDAIVPSPSPQLPWKAAETKHKVIWPVLRCLGWMRGRHGGQEPVVLKTTAWQGDLDQGHRGGPAPAAFMVRDLHTVGRPRWGILTNGSRWRLYDGEARSVAQGFLEIQLHRALKKFELLKQFVVIFRPQAFRCNQGSSCWLGATIRDHELRQGNIAAALRQQVCHQVFPALATAVAKAAPREPEELIREASLVLLYRFLFLLYGESRGLLGPGPSGYGRSLHGLVNTVAHAHSRGDTLSSKRHRYWKTICHLFWTMAHKQPSLGSLGEYFFSADRLPLLKAVNCSDETVANVLLGLCFDAQGQPIDYGDLAVEHIGGLYEQLMAHRLNHHGGTITVEPSKLSRKTASCYYTPAELVDLIVQETMAPLVQGRSAKELLNLKICDPAMGTGNFLIGLLDHMEDMVLVAMASNHDTSAREPQWQGVRNQILQHCIYGVDRDPLAVELARITLMLHGPSTDSGNLDHHLLCGNSLFGSWIGDAVKRVSDPDGSATLQALIQTRGKASAAIINMDQKKLASPPMGAQHWDALGKANAPLETVLSILHASYWLRSVHPKDPHLINELWNGSWGNPIQLVTGAIPIANQRLCQLLEQMKALIAKERFFHWQLAYPGLWSDKDEENKEGGFDAVIGNPPWDKVKLQKVEWLAQNCPDAAPAPHAAKRRQCIEQLQSAQTLQAVAYGQAAERAAATAGAARSCGDYPLLSKGDLNLYALFVERSMALVKPCGFVGLLTPSSLVSGKTGAAFFRHVAQEGRLRVLYDFENRKTFFPDVHGSFKFCVFVARKGPQEFSQGMDKGLGFCVPIPSPSPVAGAARCAFCLGSIGELRDPKRQFILWADDFKRINPNTSTAPLFRTRRHAQITIGIYRRLPVLVNRSGDHVRRTWPVTYKRMFDMSSDSHRFCSEQDLDQQGNRIVTTPNQQISSGNQPWLPLYEGKMMQAFDHRAADIIVNEKNLFRPAQQHLLSDAEKACPERRPRWRHYVHVDSKRWFWPDPWVIAFKDITSGTNMRTMIAAILPRSGVSHKLPLLLLNKTIKRRSSWACCIVANLNAIVFDFVLRQKLYGTSLTLHILEQLPVLTRSHFNIRIGSTTVTAMIRATVLELTYTAWDLAAFAKDLGYGGPPFVWNPQRRLHLRARLDALFFLLYSITSEEEVRYIYSTFPIMEKQELATYGHYRSVTACLKALRRFQKLRH